MPARTPSGVRKSSILGPNGKPVSYFLYPSPRHNLRQYRPRYWLSADTKSNVSEYDRYEMVNYARQLRAQVDLLDTAVTQKNAWAFGMGWDAHYRGKDPGWGQEAEEWLKEQFFPMCNIRGPVFNLRVSMMLSGQAWDTDGDDAMVLTESQNGFPLVAFYPATKIGSQASNLRGSIDKQGGGPDGLVKGGPFDGARIFDGVIYDRNLRMIGLRITDEAGECRDISSFSCDLAYEPVWGDQGRGIPRIAVSLLRWMNLQDIDEFLQRGMKRAASVGLKFKREGGEAGLGNEVITEEEDSGAPAGASPASAGNKPKVHYEEIEGGEMYYLDSDGNEEIEALKFENPHPNSEAFVQRLTRGALASVGWFYELLDLGETGKAPTRLLCDLANQSIKQRQASGYRRWKRIVTYAIAKGMKNGYIRKNYDGADPYLWEPGLPKEISTDAGNDEQADRENLKMGTTNKAIVAQKRGRHWKEINRQRDAEVADLIDRARVVHQRYPEVPFEMAMELLEQRNPNPVAMGKVAAAAPAAGADED